MKKSIAGMLLAGLCGGLAEVLWIALYTSMTPVSGVEVARQVAVTIFPSAIDLAAAPILGVAAHLVLSLALGSIFAWTVWIPFARQMGFTATMLIAIAALICVWAINFLVILPALNPRFVTLMPYAVTLISKGLFAMAMAWTLQQVHGRGGRSSSLRSLSKISGWSLSSKR